MRKIFLVLFFMFFSVGLFCSNWVPITSNHPEKPKIEIISSSDNETTFLVSISGYFFESVQIEGEEYSIIKLHEGSNLMEKGYPSLPFVVATIAVKPEGNVIVKSEEIGNGY